MATLEQIHLLNPLENANGGSERRTLDLYRLLSPYCETSLWSEGNPDPCIQGFPIRRVSPYRREFPWGGVLVIVGVYFGIGDWIAYAKPRRVVVIYNTPNHEQLFSLVRILRSAGTPEPEIVFVANQLKAALGLDGEVQRTPIDIDLFTARASAPRGSDFVVGRLSRDESFKHHPSDSSLYRMLSQAGCRIRIMGGTCLAPELSATPGIELLPVGEQPTHDFLCGLDCFFYRTSPQWYETLGRVVIEAMACGLPVVCHNHGGYTECIENENTGFLFETQEEAFDLILRLKNDLKLRASVGANARRAMEALFSDSAKQAIVNYYLR